MYYPRIKNIISHFMVMDEALIEEAHDRLITFEYKKNDYILRSNEVCNYFYFIMKGGARSFYITKSGIEKTRLIAFEDRILTVLQSFTQQQPSLESLQVLEDTVLLGLHRDSFFYLLDKYAEWDRFYRMMLEEAFFFQNKKIENHITLTAQERFDLLLEKRPEFIQRVSNKVLASFLDVREETLSRLKSKSRF
ncbi:Crp/Fnr family transcriptional regulator [Fulvivirga ligni]|uniref:Crp/Fnr family transcriptional regulator n=1 Tax=Fulvivirga ligni TaxID=2904246 RepID=UPI001F1B6340|nr:Crp/Fnr family transcriptional regulator [Fulvivirga ligni]UII19656.1 Crp/Fnr family transcriptional regulator [Fulvivirga ligni]